MTEPDNTDPMNNPFPDSPPPSEPAADSNLPEPNAGPMGRMVPIRHSGPLPWVQLRNPVQQVAIFRKMVGRFDLKAKNGDLVLVYDRDGKVFGTALLNTQAQIALRMLTFAATPVDESLITQRLQAAIALRRDCLKLDATTNAYRVVHAEGDGLPGLIVDRYGPYAVIELFNVGMFKRVKTLSATLQTDLQVQDVLVRSDERVQASEGFVLPPTAGGGGGSGAGKDPSVTPTGPQPQRAPARRSTVVTENGIKFQIDLTHGHKTGFFCDQRDNRLALTQFTPDRTMLDLCSYTGGFGVYSATLGKAKHVTCVDLDEDAIALAQRNANLNQVPRDRLETVHADTFPFLRQMRENQRRFDVVVLDPPKLIPTRDDFFEGRGKYFDMNKLALEVVAPGGFFITCSCSGLLSMEEFHNVLRTAARFANRRVQILRSTGPGLDHPFMADAPESSYLKCIWARVL
ncbi:MAG: class I SAM-dependent rRNA methyltransferase [Phycisphaerae bacterium]